MSLHNSNADRAEQERHRRRSDISYPHCKDESRSSRSSVGASGDTSHYDEKTHSTNFYRRSSAGETRKPYNTFFGPSGASHESSNQKGNLQSPHLVLNVSTPAKPEFVSVSDAPVSHCPEVDIQRNQSHKDPLCDSSDRTLGSFNQTYTSSCDARKRESGYQLGSFPIEHTPTRYKTQDMKKKINTCESVEKQMMGMQGARGHSHQNTMPHNINTSGQNLPVGTRNTSTDYGKTQQFLLGVKNADEESYNFGVGERNKKRDIEMTDLQSSDMQSEESNSGNLPEDVINSNFQHYYTNSTDVVMPNFHSEAQKFWDEMSDAINQLDEEEEDIRKLKLLSQETRLKTQNTTSPSSVSSDRPGHRVNTQAGHGPKCSSSSVPNSSSWNSSNKTGPGVTKESAMTQNNPGASSVPKQDPIAEVPKTETSKSQYSSGDNSFEKREPPSKKSRPTDERTEVNDPRHNRVDECVREESSIHSKLDNGSLNSQKGLFQKVTEGVVSKFVNMFSYKPTEASGGVNTPQEHKHVPSQNEEKRSKFPQTQLNTVETRSDRSAVISPQEQNTSAQNESVSRGDAKSKHEECHIVVTQFEVSEDKLDIPPTLQKRIDSGQSRRSAIITQLSNDYKKYNKIFQTALDLKMEVDNFTGISTEKTKLMGKLDVAMAEVRKLPFWDHEPIKTKIVAVLKLLENSKDVLKKKQTSKICEDLPVLLQNQILNDKKKEDSIVKRYLSRCATLDSQLCNVDFLAEKVGHFTGTMLELINLLDHVYKTTSNISDFYDYNHEPMKMKKEAALKSLSQSKTVLTNIKSDIDLDLPEDLRSYIKRNPTYLNIATIRALKESYKILAQGMAVSGELSIDANQFSGSLPDLLVLQQKVDNCTQLLKELKTYDLYSLETKINTTIKSLSNTEEILSVKELELKVDIPEELKKSLASSSPSWKKFQIEELKESYQKLDEAVEMTNKIAAEVTQFPGSLYQLQMLKENLNKTVRFIQNFKTYNHPPLLAIRESALTSLKGSKVLLLEHESDFKLDIPEALKQKIALDRSKRPDFIQQLKENRENLAKFEKEAQDTTNTANNFWGTLSELRVLVKKLEVLLQCAENVETYEHLPTKTRVQNLVQELKDCMNLLEDREPMIEAQELEMSSTEQEQTKKFPDWATLLSNSKSMRQITAIVMKLVKINRQIAGPKLTEGCQFTLRLELEAYEKALGCVEWTCELEQVLITNSKRLCSSVKTRLDQVTPTSHKDKLQQVDVVATKAVQIFAELSGDVNVTDKRRVWLQNQLLECQLNLDKLNLQEGEVREASRDVLHLCNFALENL